MHWLDSAKSMWSENKSRHYFHLLSKQVSQENSPWRVQERLFNLLTFTLNKTQLLWGNNNVFHFSGVKPCECVGASVCLKLKNTARNKEEFCSKSPHTSLSRNLSKSNLSFPMLFSFSFKFDTSDTSSNFWVSRAVLQSSSYRDRSRV